MQWLIEHRSGLCSRDRYAQLLLRAVWLAGCPELGGVQRGSGRWLPELGGPLAEAHADAAYDNVALLVTRSLGAGTNVGEQVGFSASRVRRGGRAGRARAGTLRVGQRETNEFGEKHTPSFLYKRSTQAADRLPRAERDQRSVPLR